MAAFESVSRGVIAVRRMALCCFASSVLVLGAVGVGQADQHEGELDEFWKALIGGKPTLNVRGRMSFADQDRPGIGASQAYTIRTRIGYGTAPYHGVSAYADFENNSTASKKEYNDAVNGPSDLTVIADPPHSTFNQYYLNIANDLIKGSVKGGRQRVILDDSRWIGNVGWRQKEQTFDMAMLNTSLGVDGLSLKYGYTWHVNRIFGVNDQNTAPTRDIDSNSHIINASYTGLKDAKLTGFIYLVDAKNIAPISSKTFGLRVSGAPSLSDEWSLPYVLSYANQSDYANNPVSGGYNANYFLVDVQAKYSKLGGLGVGSELLGSDDGVQQVTTPLSTLHKWNGFADVFLDNNGPEGLRDIFVYLAPKLPYKFKGKLIYHYFQNDHTGKGIGNEFDFVFSRPINKHLDVLTKLGYYVGGDRGRPDIYRFTLQAVFKL